MPLHDFFTAEQVRAMPDDGNRYETVHGELLVTPSPGGMHQWVLSRLFGVLDRYLESEHLRGLLWSPADISFGVDTLVQPDLFVADIDKMLRTGKWEDIGTLHLVAEALGPSTARADRFPKRRLYQEQRIERYWIVDHEDRRVEVWTPDALFPTVEHDQLRWRHPAATAECVIELDQLFAR